MWEVFGNMRGVWKDVEAALESGSGDFVHRISIAGIMEVWQCLEDVEDALEGVLGVSLHGLEWNMSGEA